MTDLEAAITLYQTIHLPFSSGDDYFLPPGKFGADNLQSCQYVRFFTADGNRVTHYFTPAGVYWTTISGREPS